MSTSDHTVLEFRPPVIVDPVPVDAEGFAEWLDELAGDADRCIAPSELEALLQLVIAAQRDYTDLVRQLGAGAIVSVPARAAAEAVDAILGKLRHQLTDAIRRATS